MIIIGAGMSGLLCGALNPGSVIYEAGPERESDHKALFRCKSNAIGKILGIPFKKVEIQKGLWGDGHIEPSIRAAHMYSQKVTGKITGRSIMNLDPGFRYLPPSDFIERLKAMCDVRYNSQVGDLNRFSEPIVSTIPMPAMANMMGRLNMDGLFDSKEIHVATVEIPDCDSYCTMYYPSQNFSAYRASLTGSLLAIEGMVKIQSVDIDEIRGSMGLPYGSFPTNSKIKRSIQKLGKIYPIDNKIRQEFISKLTIYDNIYSLGRFATWRPKVMLDDVLEDIFVIRRLIEGGNYSALNHKQGEK